MKIEVNDKKVKITRIDASGLEKSEIRTMESHNEAVDYCLKEEQWVIGEGYKADHTKFVYSFIYDQPLTSSQKSKKKSGKGDSNFLSVVQMTDDAISHRSRNVSTTKSDRSYRQSESGDNKY